MRDQINRAVNELGGSFSMFVDPKGPSETDKEKMSAHRQMAREMGFNVSGFKMNREHHTVTTTITRRRWCINAFWTRANACNVKINL